jgi:hypothetical protein
MARLIGHRPNMGNLRMYDMHSIMDVYSLRPEFGDVLLSYGLPPTVMAARLITTFRNIYSISSGECYMDIL